MDYSKTELYMLSHNVDKNKDVYIGHTTNWKNRKREHSYNTRCISSKKYYIKKYVYIRDNDGWENWSMELIETYPCLSFYEATKRETYWVKFYNAKLNQTTPQRDIKQYRIDAKEKIQKTTHEYWEKHKEYLIKKRQEYKLANPEITKENHDKAYKKYFEKNKEQIREKCRLRAKEKKTCDICGNVVNMSAMSRHKNSFKCKNFICQ